MRVYQVVADVNNYQQILCSNDEDAQRESLRKRPRNPATWEPPRVFAYNPGHQVPDIWQFSPAFDLVFSPGAVEALRPILEIAGNLLPLPLEDGRELHLLDLKLVNCLDPDATEWAGPRRPPGSPYPQPAIKRPAFHTDRWTEATLFKFPEARTRAHCVEGLHGPEDEFKATVERLGLTGVNFKLVWDSEAETT